MPAKSLEEALRHQRRISGVEPKPLFERVQLTPAYGRDYKSKKAIQADLDADKDFILNDPMSRWDGKPINKTQLLDAGHKEVIVRYGKMRKVTTIKIKK